MSIHLLDSHLNATHNHEPLSYQPTRNLGVGVDNVAELDNLFVNDFKIRTDEEAYDISIEGIKADLASVYSTLNGKGPIKSCCSAGHRGSGVGCLGRKIYTGDMISGD